MRKIIITILILSASTTYAQNNEPVFEDLETNLWLSSYNKFRIADKLYWAAELHYRRVGTTENPFIDKMAQIYNRHGLSYVFSRNFNVTAGGVLRLNFTPEPGNEEFKPVDIEPRIWHQYIFVSPWPRFIMYNRVRIEHRWNRSNRLDAEWIYRNRWRYMFYMKIPLNNKQLTPGTFYFSPSVELIMQTGKAVVGTFVEDLRLYGNITYIASPRLSTSLGLMYTTGQDLNNPEVYGRRYILRLSTYISLDFRKEERKVPSIRTLD